MVSAHTPPTSQQLSRPSFHTLPLSQSLSPSPLIPCCCVCALSDELGNFYYGPSHPMKPHRIRMAHNLVLAYGLYKKLEIYRPTLMSEEQMTKFHADDYIHFLQHVTLDNHMDYGTEQQRYNLDVDCPVFDGMFKFCQMYTGGSVGGAYKLNRQTADICINWLAPHIAHTHTRPPRSCLQDIPTFAALTCSPLCVLLLVPLS